MSEYRSQQLPPYILGDVSRAVLEVRREGHDVIDLSQFNPEAGPPSAAVDRLVQNVLLPHNHRYSSSQGITLLRTAIANWYERRFGVTLDVDHEIVVTLGTKEGLTHLLLATLFPGDTVLLPTPAYPIHSAAIFLAGAGRIGVELFPPASGEESGGTVSAKSEAFFHALDHAIQHAWPKPRALLCSFPHNPTTTTASLDFHERLVEFAEQNKIFLVHDFAYGDFTFDEYRAPSILQARGARECAVEFYSLSKIFCVPGWRISFCVGNRHLIAALKRLKSYVDSGAFQPIQIAAAKLLESGESRIEEVQAMYQSRRDVLVSGLREIGWDVPRAPVATPFLWTRLPESLRKLGGMQATERLLHDTKVAVCPGLCFDTGTEEFARFSLVEKEPRLRLATKRLGGVRG